MNISECREYACENYQQLRLRPTLWYGGCSYCYCVNFGGSMLPALVFFVENVEKCLPPY